MSEKNCTWKVDGADAEKCSFPEVFCSSYSRKTATRLDFRKPLPKPVSAQRQLKTHQSVHSRRKSEAH